MLLMTDRKSMSKEEAEAYVSQKYDSHDHSPAYDEALRRWPEANTDWQQTHEAAGYVADRLLEEWGFREEDYVEETFSLVAELLYEMVWAGLT
jgi:hypothetical protein